VRQELAMTRIPPHHDSTLREVFKSLYQPHQREMSHEPGGGQRIPARDLVSLDGEGWSSHTSIYGNNCLITSILLPRWGRTRLLL